MRSLRKCDELAVLVAFLVRVLEVAVIVAFRASVLVIPISILGKEHLIVIAVAGIALCHHINERQVIRAYADTGEDF